VVAAEGAGSSVCRRNISGNGIGSQKQQARGQAMVVNYPVIRYFEKGVEFANHIKTP
jgi:hypothetical protein